MVVIHRNHGFGFGFGRNQSVSVSAEPKWKPKPKPKPQFLIKLQDFEIFWKILINISAHICCFS